MTATIDALLATKDGAARTSINELQIDDIADLAIRAANIAADDWLRALSALAHAAFKNEGAALTLAPIVDQLLQLPGVASTKRAMLVSLAATAHPNAVPVLLAAAQDLDQDVAFAAWQGLQLVARSENLDQLRAIAPPPGDIIGNLASFTLAVVSYRAGSTGHELPTYDDSYIVGVPGDEETLYSINQSETNEEDFALVAALSNTERYQVPAAIGTTTTINCGTQHLLLCLDPDAIDASPSTLVQAPAMPAVMATVSPLGGSCAVRFLFLSHPDGEGGFWVGGYLRNGTIVYQGHARAENITGETATFSLWAMQRPGVRPIALEIALGATGVALQSDRVTTMNPWKDPLEPTPTE